MSKTDRVTAALRGEPVDRLPWSAWFHFGLHFLPGPEMARVHLEFYRHYKPDFLKLMHDYPYPLSAGVTEVRTAEDLKTMSEVHTFDAGGLGQQLQCIDAVVDDLRGEAFAIDTIFDPWVIVRKRVGRPEIRMFQEEHPEVLKAALNGVAHTMAGYVRAALDRGLSGVFYSSGMAGRDKMSDDEYNEWCRPYDEIVLNAAEGADFNLLHVHGNNVRLAEMLDYPNIHAWNWAGQETSPSLEEGRGLTDRCLVGGIDQDTATNVSAESIRQQVRDAVEALGTTGTIIAPGCAVQPNMQEANIRAIVEAIEELAG